MAAEDPSAIIYEPIDITKGLSKEQALTVIKKVGLEEVADNVTKVLLNMYDMFIKKDALLVEINPFAEDAGETCEYLNERDLTNYWRVLFWTFMLKQNIHFQPPLNCIESPTACICERSLTTIHGMLRL